MIILEPLSVWRLVLIGLFSILVGMRLYFRHRFRRMWRPPRPREEGLLGFLLHGALVIFLWAVTLLVMFRPGWISWALFQAPLWLRLVGVGLSASGLFLIGWSHVHLGKEFDTTIDASRHQVLVVTGPYQYVRHPLYVAFFVFFIGAGLTVGAWAISAAGAALFFLLMTVRLRKEERQLVERFGRSYLEYAARTPRFFPRMRHMSSAVVLPEALPEKSSTAGKASACR